MYSSFGGGSMKYGGIEDGIVMYLEGPRRDPVSHELDTRQVGSVEELYDRQQQFFLENQKKRLD